MNNPTQLERYKKLLSYIDENFREEVNIQKIEEISFYSYRNINRIFEAIHNETIGKYVKRLRLEKAAQFLKYSEESVSKIAYEVGFEDRAAFSKAFKSKYGCSPSVFRDSNQSLLEKLQDDLLAKNDERIPLRYEIESLPEFEYLFLEHRGDQQDFAAIEKTWDQLFEYVTKKGLLSDQSVFFTEIIDDDEISDQIHSRFNLGLILDRPLEFDLESFFKVKSHKRQKYAKFTHQGSHESSIDFYHQIYAFWMMDVGLEMADKSMLEFYPNFEENQPEEDIITEIYIPVI